MADLDGTPTEVKRPKSAWYLVLFSALVMIGIAVLVVVYREEVRNLDQYGYAGAFVVSVMSGATVIVYVPGVPVVFALGGVLPFPFLVGLAAGLGEGLGAFTSYGAGRGSHGLLSEKQLQNKYFKRVQTWMARRGYLTVFLASAIFNPFFVAVGATAGAMRMSPWKFYLVCAAGKAVKGTYVAYLGYWGLPYILEWFHIEV